MHPKSSLLCSICLALFAFLLWPSISRTETLSDKIRRFVRGEADTLFALPAEGLTLIRHSGNYFLFIQPIDPTKDLYSQGRKLVLFEASKGILWEKKFARWVESEITDNENATPRVISGYWVEEGAGVTEVYDTQGTRVAEIRGTTVFSPSPSGVYFYSVPSKEGGYLQVYDSLGNRLWSRLPVGGWNVAAPSDSFLVFADNDSLLFLKAKDGRAVVGWVGDPYRDKIGLTSHRYVCKNGKFFLLSQPMGSNSYLFSFSYEKGLLWNGEFDWFKGTLADAALGPDGRIVGATFLVKGQSTHRILKFYDNFDKGKLLSEFKFDVGKGYAGCPKSSIEIFDSLATVTLPTAVDLFYWRGINDSTATKVFVFEPKNRTVVDTFTVRGFFTPVNSSIKDTQYFQVAYDEENKKILVLRSK